ESVVPAASNAAMGRAGVRSYRDLKTHVVDRSAHDRRYAVDCGKARRELGWSPRRDFEEGLAETVRWYVANREWVGPVQAKARYERERLGVGAERGGA